MRRFVVFLMLLSLLMTQAAAAQDDACPVGHQCVEYGEDIVAIDPTMGPYQVVIVEERITTIRTFSGEDTEHAIMAAVFVQNGETFIFDRDFIEEREGIFATADLGDVFILREAD